MTLLPGIVKSLFSMEENPIRFESVCIDLIREDTGIPLVPTSKTWDRGRDARSISPPDKTSTRAVICATLSNAIDGKVEADIKRLSQTTQTNQIYYCSSQDLTEDALDKLIKTIREIYARDVDIVPLARRQLSFLGEKYPAVLRKYYRPEIEDTEKALLFEPSQVEDPEALGLRLALLTQTDDNAVALRAELSRYLVLQALVSRGSQGPSDIASYLSQQLHLPRAMSSDYISTILVQLENEDLIQQESGKASIINKGMDFLKHVPEEATERLLEGRAAIRDEIKALTGYGLTDEHFEAIWKVLSDGLAALFHTHGSQLVRMSGSLLTDEDELATNSGPELFETLAAQIGATFTDPSQGREVRQAIVDIFSDKDTNAFTWLTQICSVYVMMCSLGFETVTNHEISKALSNLPLVADTDIVLSLLCKGETSHQEVVRLLNNWRAIGGTLLLSTQVLTEVAYHAWISQNDYLAMHELIPHLSAREAKHLIGNAFVRSFVFEANRTSSRRYWELYIRQYRGKTEWDYSNVLSILRDEYGFEQLPDSSDENQPFVVNVNDFLLKRVKQEDVDRNYLDKTKRDALMCGSILNARNQARAAGSRKLPIALSSSRALRDVEKQFRKELGKPEAVMSLPALACLLTLTPGVTMHLGTLRRVLFDVGFTSKLAPITRQAMRVIKASGEYYVPWSRRVSLEQELTSALVTEAHARGESVRDTRDRIIRAAEPEESAVLIAKALQSLAVSSHTEEKVIDQEKTIEKLREELRTRKK